MRKFIAICLFLIPAALPLAAQQTAPALKLPRASQHEVVTQTVGLIPQTITFATSAPNDALVAGPAYQAAATASSGNPPPFSFQTDGLRYSLTAFPSLSRSSTCDQPKTSTAPVRHHHRSGSPGRQAIMSSTTRARPISSQPCGGSAW